MIAMPFYQECPGFSRSCCTATGVSCSECILHRLLMAHRDAESTPEQKERRRSADTMLRQVSMAGAAGLWGSLQEWLGSQGQQGERRAGGV